MESHNKEMDQSPSAACQNQIEPLEGEVCLQFIRCGKAGCRCQSGRLHGPYYYRIWREGSRVRKVYIKAADVEAVKVACALHRSLSLSLQEVRQMKRHLTQSIQREWRRTERFRQQAAIAQ